MEKISICAKITSKEFNNQETMTIGIKDNNKIEYKENEIDVTIKILKNKILLYRESKTEKIKLEFINNKESVSYIKSKDIKIPIDILTKEIRILENKIYIKYYINNEEFEYDISWRC